MEDLEKLPQAFANSLYVKYSAVSKEESGESATQDAPKATYKPASEETREAFKEIMQKHLVEKLSQCCIGSSVSYDYSTGKLRNARPEHKGSLVLTVNPNMQDILSELSELSELEEGEEYIFPANMTASIKVIGFTEEGLMTKVERLSAWIANALAMM